MFCQRFASMAGLALQLCQPHSSVLFPFEEKVLFCKYGIFFVFQDATIRGTRPPPVAHRSFTLATYMHLYHDGCWPGWHHTFANDNLPNRNSHPEQVLFYQTEGMRYFTQIECRNRRGTKKRGCKVSGFAFKRTGVGNTDTSGKEVGGDAAASAAGRKGRSGGSSPALGHSSEPPLTPVFGGSVGRGGGGGGGGGTHIPEQLLVTTNDSRLRLYNTDDFGMNAKYKGFANDTLQITATFSEDGKQIICGSENGKVCTSMHTQIR